MKRLWLLTAFAALLAAHPVPGAWATDGSTFVATPNAGDTLFGYHVYGTETNPRGFVLDYNDTTSPGSLGWSMGMERSYGDFYLFNYNYLNAGTTTASNTYFFRMRGDTGQLEVGPNAPHSTGSLQMNVTAGTSATPRLGLGVGIWGNQYNLYLYQNQPATTSKRTQISFNNTYQMGTDSTGLGVADWWLYNSGTGHQMLIANPDDSLTVKYGLQHTGSTLGFYSATPVTKQTVTGCRSDGTALASLITALKNLGLVNDQTTP